MKFEKEYTESDKYCIINADDSVLRPIVLRLPDPPDLKLIDGYGLPKVEQKFFRRLVPDKLNLIEKRARKKAEEFNNSHQTQSKWNGYHVQKEFWRIIEEEKDSLEEEIKWIKHTWYFLRHGYWFYNYGKPTWITPWYFQYLNFYYMAEAGCYPEYRDRDRRSEVFNWYCYTTTETFKDVDENGRSLSFEMIDMINRVCYGDIEAKRRRGGVTAQDINHGLWIFMRVLSAYCEVVADTGDHSKGIFEEKLSPAWYHFPLVLKPVWDGDERPLKSISLNHPRTVMKENCIGSEFGYTETSSERANDSRKLSYILQDEQGKGMARGRVKTRWGINKLTMSQMLQIIGYSDHPSTVEEMEEGGSEFRSMFYMSDFYQRKRSGQTFTGLFRKFFKAYDGADHFIDAWGYSVIDTPTEDQIKYAPKENSYVSLGMGARQYLENELSIYLRDGSPDKLREYREMLRKNPMDSTDCWRGAAGNMGFNVIILDKAIIDSVNYKVIQGNFSWAGGIRDSRVVWNADPKGRWFVSNLLPGRENKFKTSKSNYQNPTTGKFEYARTPYDPKITTAGVDSFRFRTTSQIKTSNFGENTSLSDGGGAVFLNFDSSIDGDKIVDNWITNKFICTYRSRPSLDDYCEDMLMMCFYYGSMCNGERNTEYMIDYFIKRGYAGYLLYMLDGLGNTLPQPWIYSGGENSAPKTDMLAFTKEHIDLHGHRECHTDLLTEWKNLSSQSDLHTKDLAAAAGWALYGSRKGYHLKYDRIENGPVLDLSATWLKEKSF